MNDSLLSTKSYADLIVALARLEDPATPLSRRHSLLLTLEEDLHNTGLVPHLRGTLARAGKIERLHEVLSRLSTVVERIDFSGADWESQVLLGNVAFVAPTVLWSRLPDVQSALSAFTYFATTRLLVREENYLRLVSALRESPDLKLSPVLAAHGALRAPELERGDLAEILRRFLASIGDGPGTEPAHDLVSARLTPQRSASRHGRPLGVPRAALFITGEFGDWRSLREWSRYFDLPRLDVFVSATLPPASEAVRQTVVQSARQGALPDKRDGLELDRSARHALDTRSDRMAGLERGLERALQDARTTHVRLEDATDRDGSVVNQHEFAQRHNAYWLSRLGSDYFREQYDILIKFTPNLRLSDYFRLGPDTLEDPGNDVVNNTPDWIFEHWGFGMTDRFFYGRTDTMLPLLDISDSESCSTRLMSECLGPRNAYRQHTNVGIEHWMRAGGIRGMGMPPASVSSASALSLSELEQLAEYGGASSHVGSGRTAAHA